MRKISDRKTKRLAELDRAKTDIEKNAAMDCARNANAPQNQRANLDCHGRPIAVGCVIVENDHPDKPRGLVVAVNGGSLLYRFEGDEETCTQFAYTRDCTLVESFTISEAEDYLYRQNETRPISKDGKLIEPGDIVQEDGNAEIGRVMAVDNEAVIIRPLPGQNMSNKSWGCVTWDCTVMEKDAHPSLAKPLNLDEHGTPVCVGDLVQEDGVERVGRVLAVHEGALIIRLFGGQKDCGTPLSIGWPCHQCAVLTDDSAACGLPITSKSKE